VGQGELGKRVKWVKSGPLMLGRTRGLEGLAGAAQATGYTSVASAISRASSISMPRYRAVELPVPEE
jgi:hypothetical protein